jgi:hypothetical protein
MDGSSNGGVIMTGEENRRAQTKTCLSATFSTTIPTDLALNSGLRGEKPVTSRLSYGTATYSVLLLHDY